MKLPAAALTIAALALAGCGGGGAPDPTDAERDQEYRRVYRACAAIYVDPDPYCRKVARQCAYLLGTLDQTGDIPDGVWRNANKCVMWGRFERDGS